MNYKVVANYCRVSTREQAEYGYSLLDQEDKNKSYLRVYEDDFPRGTVIRPYIDEGQSAKDLNRKELKRLIEDIKKGEIDTVIIHNLDRLTRRIKDLIVLLELFNLYDVKLISIKEKVETDTAMGRFFISVIILIAQWEQETIGERTRRGMDRSAMEGNYVHGQAPFGYIKVGKKLEIYQTEADIVQTIFKMYLVDQRSMLSISLYLNSISEFNMKWTHDRIKIILSNAVYTGLYENERITIENHSPQIIDNDQFELAQKRLEFRNNKVRYNYLFKGMVRSINEDEKIEHKSTIKPNKTYLYYMNDKTKIRINEDIITKQITSYIDNFINKNIMSDVENRIKNLKRKDSMIKELICLYEEGLVCSKFYTTTVNGLNNEVITLEQSIGLVNENVSSWNTMDREEKGLFSIEYINYILVDFHKGLVLGVKFNKSKSKANKSMIEYNDKRSKQNQYT